MDPVANPYTPNAGSRPPELAGRGMELRQFEVLIGRLKRGSTEQSMIIKGLRGVGKTVLLNAFENQAESQGFLAYYHELAPESLLAAEIARDGEKALTRLSLSERVGTKIREALGHLRTIRLTGPEGFGLEVDLKGADEGAVTSDLTDLFVQLGEAAKSKDRGVVFLLDEVQFANEIHFRAMISALHRATQRSLPITVAAAGLPQIPRLTGEARSYAERLFTFPTIGNLGEDAARAALTEPARQQRVKYESEAVARALDWTAGYPFYIQQLGKHAWNTAHKSPITLENIEAAIPVAQEALDSSLYEVRAQRATPAERQYMRAMAELGAGPYRSGAVATKLGKSSAALSQLRDRLISKGLIYATEDFGHLDFSVPRFDEFMRRYMHYKAPTKPKKAAARKGATRARKGAHG
ncbi:MAG: ATP-binding protein [Actinomycetota bacterium]|nr:ATP-binding protein [Actinomycetota bacterium]